MTTTSGSPVVSIVAPVSTQIPGMHDGAGRAVPDLDAAPLAIIVDLVRRGQASTRTELIRETSLNRKAVTQRVEQAIDLGLLESGDLAPSAGGRQPRTLQFRAHAGYILACSLGASEITAALTDLNGTPIETLHDDWEVSTGPQATMRHVHNMFQQLARKQPGTTPWAIGVGMPGPVDFDSGRLVAPPIMPGWDGFSARAWLRDHFDAPIWVDNDVNLMALGEWTSGTGADGRDMLFIKVGTGIGAGIIVNGRLVRGQHGAAGDIGHIHVTDDPSKICRCGKTGCLEAVASGWSLLDEAEQRAGESDYLASQLANHGHLRGIDIGDAAAQNDPLILELIKTRTKIISDVVSNLVNFVNPGTVVVGGGVLRTQDIVLETISETIFRRGTDLATRDLDVRGATLNFHEGVIGAALLASGHILDASSMTHWVEHGTPVSRGAALQNLGRAVL